MQLMLAEIDFTAVLVGAAVGACGAVMSGWLLERKKNAANLDGILASIHDELEVLGATYVQKVGEFLSQGAPTEPFMARIVLKQKYFIVYPTNTVIIGQLRDQDLRRSIITTYNRANFLLEAIESNNSLLDRSEVLFEEEKEAKNKVFLEHSQRLKHAMAVHHNRMLHAAKRLQAIHRNLTDEMERTMAGIRRYRDENQVWLRNFV